MAPVRSRSTPMVASRTVPVRFKATAEIVKNASMRGSVPRLRNVVPGRVRAPGVPSAPRAQLQAVRCRACAPVSLGSRMGPAWSKAPSARKSLPAKRSVVASIPVRSFTARTGVFVLPAAVDAGPVSGRAQVAAAVAARRRNGTWRLPAFRTNGDRRLFLRLSKVAALAAALPPAAVSFMLGPQGVSQVGASDARALVMRLLEDKAGPEGEAAAKATRALRLLQERASRDRLPDSGLPASRALVASIVAAEGRRAECAARGSQGGRTVAGTVREGFLFLQKVARLPIEADGVRASPTADGKYFSTLRSIWLC